MEKTNYEDFVKDFGSKLKHSKPLRGQIELTYHCNLDCIHCYCKGSEGKGKELTTRQWKGIFDQIHKEGCLWLTFTGGEPLLRNDFKELYVYARKKGFLVNIFTNGTVFSSDLLELFETNPPFMIEVSLYGTSEGVYESITQVAGSFRKIWKNINKLLKIKMPIVLKTVGLKQNKHEILKVKAIADRILGKKRFKFDSFIFPGLNGDTGCCKYRLSPKEILEIEGKDADMIEQRHKELHMPHDLLRPREFLYQCNSWMDSFYINPYGRLQFCHLSKKYSSDLTQTRFRQAFYDKFPQLLNDKFTSTSKCKSCELRIYCYFCPARAFLETGDQEHPVEYYCELARASFEKEQFLKHDPGK